MHFSDYTSAVSGFKSISQNEREKTENGIQTVGANAADEGVQCFLSHDMHTQTELPPARHENANLDAVAAFLRKIEPLLMEELKANVDLNGIDETDEQSEHSVTKIDSIAAPDGLVMRVSDLSWNCTGGTLAVAFSAVQHDTWCNHDSAVTIHTRSLNRPVSPRTLLTSSCISSICFHPWEPSVLVVGLYNGDIAVYDLRKDNDWTIAESDSEHEGRVVHVGWFQNSSGPQCLTAASDGRILLRKIGFAARNISVSARFLVTRGIIDTKFSDKEAGLEIATLTHLRHEECVIGVGRGGLLHIDLSRQQPIASHPGYSNPTVLAYQPHNAVVTSVRAGPYGNSFASVSSDGEIRVYTPLQVEPKYVVINDSCLLDVFWCLESDLLGVCGTTRGVTFVSPRTNNVFELDGPADNYAATAAEINNKRNVVAIGNADGVVNIWRIVTNHRKQ